MHQKHLQFFGIVNQKFVETIGKKVSRCLVGTYQALIIKYIRRQLYKATFLPNPMAGCGIVPLNLLRTLESIPFCLRHEERPKQINYTAIK
jgi:hypothetical protein